MKREIGGLAPVTVLVYGVVNFIPPIVRGGVLSSLVSEVWGNQTLTDRTVNGVINQ
jgi:hypothetical protein